MKFDKSKLKITPSSFRNAKNLQGAFGRALLKNSLNFGLTSINEDDILQSEISDNSVGEMIRSVLQLVVSDEVERGLFVCAEKALYDTQKINEEYFEPVERRSLFYPIMFEIAKVNIGPFIESLFSQFEGLLKIVKGIPK